jgi:protein-S-isoprenylcysteine O-methyltransferase Ste14
MAGRGINAYLVFLITVAAVSATALFIWPVGLMFSLMNVFACVMEVLVLRFTRPAVLKRRISADNWWDRFIAPLIALFAVASAALSLYDNRVAMVSVLPAWCFILGIVLLMSAYIVLSQSLRANAPHAGEKYGEEPVEGAERGPYEVVRYPVMLAVTLAGISIPLVMCSGIGFIPVGLLIAAVVTQVALEDDYRFNNYEWFYDYTKEVSYRLIPFIW